MSFAARVVDMGQALFPTGTSITLTQVEQMSMLRQSKTAVRFIEAAGNPPNNLIQLILGIVEVNLVIY